MSNPLSYAYHNWTLPGIIHQDYKNKKAAKKQAEKIEKHNDRLFKQQKQAFKNYEKFQQKYGDEAFQQFPIFNRAQESVLKKFGQRGAEPRANRKEFQKYQTAFGLGELPRPRQLAGLEDIRQNPLFQAERSRVQDLLNPTGQAFRDFAQPELNNFRQQIVPEIGAQFGQGVTGGSGSSAFNQALAGAQGNLQAKLASLRRGLQQQGGMQALNLAQAPIANQLYYNPQRQAQNAQEFSNAYYGNQQNIGLGQGINELNFRQGSEALRAQPFANIYRPPGLGQPFNPNAGYQQQPPAGPSFLSNLAPAIGMGIGAAAGGPAGAYFGQAAGQAARGFF